MIGVWRWWPRCRGILPPGSWARSLCARKASHNTHTHCNMIGPGDDAMDTRHNHTGSAAGCTHDDSTHDGSWLPRGPRSAAPSVARARTLSSSSIPLPAVPRLLGIPSLVALSPPPFDQSAP